MSRVSTNNILPGLSLVELIVAIAVITLVFTGGFEIFRLAVTTTDRARQYTMAELLTQDLLELAISKRNEDWNSLIPGEYYFDELYNFVPGTETVDEFTRSVLITAVHRDGGLNIVSNGGELDPDTVLVTARSSWQQNGQSREVELQQYLTNWSRF